jgi:hypothetical protein
MSAARSASPVYHRRRISGELERHAASARPRPGTTTGNQLQALRPCPLPDPRNNHDDQSAPEPQPRRSRTAYALQSARLHRGGAHGDGARWTSQWLCWRHGVTHQQVTLAQLVWCQISAASVLVLTSGLPRIAVKLSGAMPRYCQTQTDIILARIMPIELPSCTDFHFPVRSSGPETNHHHSCQALGHIPCPRLRSKAAQIAFAAANSSYRRMLNGTHGSLFLLLIYAFGECHFRL